MRRFRWRKSDRTAAAGGSAETSAAAETGSTGGEKVITMAQTGDWDTFMPMNTTNAGADNVIELMFGPSDGHQH